MVIMDLLIPMPMKWILHLSARGVNRRTQNTILELLNWYYFCIFKKYICKILGIVIKLYLISDISMFCYSTSRFFLLYFLRLFGVRHVPYLRAWRHEWRRTLRHSVSSGDSRPINEWFSVTWCLVTNEKTNVFY